LSPILSTAIFSRMAAYSSIFRLVVFSRSSSLSATTSRAPRRELKSAAVSAAYAMTMMRTGMIADCLRKMRERSANPPAAIERPKLSLERR